MKTNPRQERVADQIRDVLAQAMLRDVSDPRIGRVHIQAVKLSPDLTQGKIYWACLYSEDNTPETREKLQRALDKARGFFRQQLGKELRMRTIPELFFQFDTSSEVGRKMESLLATLEIPPADPNDGTT
jgi:ribosome-binding factor A